MEQDRFFMATNLYSEIRQIDKFITKLDNDIENKNVKLMITTDSYVVCIHDINIAHKIVSYLRERSNELHKQFDEL